MSHEPLIPEDVIARQPPDAQAIIRLLLAKIAELEARLNQSPRNSSLPPSSEHPHAKPSSSKAKSKRKPGGQPGHAKHERPLIPTADCDEVVTLKPSACRRCGTHLTGRDPAPLRHQVWELPEIKPLVTEYQRHRMTCSGCGTTTCGQLPRGVPQGQAGPRLIALTALLMGCFKQSKRRVAMFLEQILNQPCSPSWVVKLQASRPAASNVIIAGGATVRFQNVYMLRRYRSTAALTPAYVELTRQLPTVDVLGIDESPTKQARTKSWLWGFVAGTYTVFALRTTRGCHRLARTLDRHIRWRGELRPGQNVWPARTVAVVLGSPPHSQLTSTDAPSLRFSPRCERLPSSLPLRDT